MSEQQWESFVPVDGELWPFGFRYRRKGNDGDAASKWKQNSSLCGCEITDTNLLGEYVFEQPVAEPSATSEQVASAVRELAGKTVENLAVYDEEERKAVRVSRDAVQAGIVLANHFTDKAADNDKPATIAWVRSVVECGESEDPDIDDRYVSFGPYDGMSLSDVDEEGPLQLWCNEYQLGDIEKRGQFRQLCRALGIQLKEDDPC